MGLREAQLGAEKLNYQSSHFPILCVEGRRIEHMTITGQLFPSKLWEELEDLGGGGGRRFLLYPAESVGVFADAWYNL